MPKSKPIGMENRIVLDTNILVSALIGSSYPKQILFECVLENKFVLCVSEVILDEYRDVLNRPKFNKFPNFVEKANSLLDSIEKIAEYYQPTITIARIFDDADNRFLELALTANAHYIITGNFTDFDFAEYEDVKIVNPKYFYEEVCLTTF